MEREKKRMCDVFKSDMTEIAMDTNVIRKINFDVEHLTK